MLFRESYALETVMTRSQDDLPRDPRRLNAALRLVLRRYGAQIRRRPSIAIPALILPGVADALIFYAPPLVVAKVLGTFARDNQPTATDLCFLGFDLA